MHCDVCNATVQMGFGERITQEVFTYLLDNGFGLNETNIKMLTDAGISRPVAEAALKEQYGRSRSDWLLCPNCAAEAVTIIAKRDEKWVSPEYIAVTRTAEEVGLGFDVYGAPVALSRVVWEECVEWTEEDSKLQTYQEQDARLWDVLFSVGISLQLKGNQFFKDWVHRYSIICIPRNGTSKNGVTVNLLMQPTKIRGQQWFVIEKDEQAPPAND